MNLELNGTNVINENERGGKASSLFWPWCGANVSLLALSYGAFFLGFGISFWQATLAAFLGTVLSFLLVGFSSLAGKKSNAPTMVLARATFGVKGYRFRHRHCPHCFGRSTWLCGHYAHSTHSYDCHACDDWCLYLSDLR